MSNIHSPHPTIPPPQNNTANPPSDDNPKDTPETRLSRGRKITRILNVKLPCQEDTDTTWDIALTNHNDNTNTIASIKPHNPQLSEPVSSPQTLHGNKSLLLPALCHPHIHLDKCFLLSSAQYADLAIQSGDFAEALSLTSRAKARFTGPDLRRRGGWLVEESIAAGVTCMRAFVEVDATVRFQCLEAGLWLRERYRGACEIQICVFAQEAVFSGQGAAEGEGRALMEEAVRRDGVDVIGSTPYVEADEGRMRANVDWAVEVAIRCEKHLDLHLDYHLDGGKEPMVYYVIEALKKKGWMQMAGRKTIVLGHCSRLTLFTSDQWCDLKDRIGDLPISFVGLPTSDLFMMGRPSEPKEGSERVRGTLQIPQLIEEYQLQGTFGVNNVGNAFTPHGNCDPLSLASMCVGVYQAGTKRDAEVLYECISTRAKAAIGRGNRNALKTEEGDEADFVLLNTDAHQGGRPKGTLQEMIYDPPRERSIIRRGHFVHVP